MHSAGNSWMFKRPRAAHSDGRRHAAVRRRYFREGPGLVLDTARTSKFPLPLSAAAHQMFMMASTASISTASDAEPSVADRRATRAELKRACRSARRMPVRPCSPRSNAAWIPRSAAISASTRISCRRASSIKPVSTIICSRILIPWALPCFIWIASSAAWYCSDICSISVRGNGNNRRLPSCPRDRRCVFVRRVMPQACCRRVPMLRAYSEQRLALCARSASRPADRRHHDSDLPRHQARVEPATVLEPRENGMYPYCAVDI
ncbi:D-beta-hydroxybutyrate dehydrogenase [Candidatus Burkholderia pumila]|uniref:D-beta-hydroxybutyrate dehydrogenase n=1 Tax=Candidatus Burkholderia pumila TaxID=1090375 RepID=A0ABR5HLG8_9BURK|nr:D-beta-hydroxybutyrate dehydrogenase [Candidatus Burkholderia pumila]